MGTNRRPRQPLLATRSDATTRWCRKRRLRRPLNVVVDAPAEPAEEVEGPFVRLDTTEEPHVRRLHLGRHTRQARHSSRTGRPRRDRSSAAQNPATATQPPPPTPGPGVVHRSDECATAEARLRPAALVGASASAGSWLGCQRATDRRSDQPLRSRRRRAAQPGRDVIETAGQNRRVAGPRRFPLASRFRRRKQPQQFVRVRGPAVPFEPRAEGGYEATLPIDQRSIAIEAECREGGQIEVGHRASGRRAGRNLGARRRLAHAQQDR